ncbi:MAG TPA: HNH endonuclease signature motif containing protein [Pseudonocardiaceae bacterium]|nr:HNH endonuclease signature motif containing protein [Pseudonocardiaceae bacterium]
MDRSRLRWPATSPPQAPDGASSPTRLRPAAGLRHYPLPPPTHLAELVITRDQTCQFPGCRVPAHRCDHNHGVPYDPQRGTGPTSDTNLGIKCRRHHQVKQSLGWSVTHHPDGCTTWITPSGHQYHSRPPPLTDPELLTVHPLARSGRIRTFLR